jgi:hypothetical protein
MKIYPRNNRTLDPDKPVRIYRNLNAKSGSNKEWSVLQNGLVIGHTNSISLKNCIFIVSDSGRQRVLRDKRKNVHAFIQGQVDTATDMKVVWNPNYKVAYNPYKSGDFFVGNDVVKTANYVNIQGKDVILGN